MNHENRVLNRTGARQLTPEEIAAVYGAMRIHTATVCTLSATGGFDGDPGEC